ncbi:MAG: hypothetical protein IKA36_02785 [Clostridia bacterium]|nr:hypothetical protein [Clostridia bacterium]
MRFEIRHDVYEISKRIKDIDRYYFIVYDTSKSCFEIHNSSQTDSTYCLTLPYKQLDERVLQYVRETSSANIERILEKIEKENKLIENEEKRKVLNQLNQSIEEI